MKGKAEKLKTNQPQRRLMSFVRKSVGLSTVPITAEAGNPPPQLTSLAKYRTKPIVMPGKGDHNHC